MSDAAAGPGAPSALGGYVITRELGRGGAGVVYEARHGVSGEPVALKTVLVARAALLGGIRREIRALARLSHPGIVRIVAEGVSAGLPWYAMELLPGTTLRAVLDASGRLPAPVAVGTVGRLCGALAHMHGRGIVHRDLKPENVLVRSDGAPIIIDFGALATSSAHGQRETLGHAGELVGTPEYMAPEQGSGDVVDARADLYAAGCLLYELLVGEPPFAGTLMEVLSAHAAEAPVPPSARVPGIPGGLDHVVLNLLAKDPTARPGHAAAVAHALRPFGQGGDGAAEDGDRVPAAYLYRPAFRGRGEARRGLSRHLRAAAAGKGTIVALAGEAGSGRTRLATVLAQEASALGMEVTACACRGASEGLLGQLLEPIADACREGGARTAERLLGPYASVLASIDPDVRVLPGAAPLAPTEPVELQRVLDAMRSAWRAFATRPRLVVVDDVHLAEDAGIDLLAHLARSEAFADRPVMILATSRRDASSSPLRRLHARCAEVVELAPMSEGELAEIAADMMALPGPWPELTGALAARASGNPSLLVEQLRMAVDEGLLHQDRAGAWSTTSASGGAELAAALPESLDDLLGRRAARLPGEERVVAEVCSVLRSGIDGRTVASVAGLPETAALDGLEELRRRGVLEPAAGSELGFVYPRLAEILEAGLDGDARRRLHLAAAGQVEAEAEAPGKVERLARHYLQGGDLSRARPLLRRAGEEALARHAIAAGGDLLRTYLAHEDPRSAAAVEARVALAERVLLQSSVPEAVAELRIAVDAAAATGDLALASLAWSALGHACQLQGLTGEALAAFERAEADAREAGHPQRLAAVLSRLGSLLGDLGRAAEAGDRLAEALQLAERDGTEGRLAALLTATAATYHATGRRGDAVALMERSLELYRRAGNARGEGLALGNLAAMALEEGRLDAGCGLLRAALESDRAVGDRQLEAGTLINLGIAAHEAGDDEGAIRHTEEAADIARRVGSVRLLSVALGNLASFRLNAGRLDGLDDVCREATEIGRAASDPRIEGSGLMIWASIGFQLGRFEEARARCDAAVACFSASGARGLEAEALVVGSRGARWAGDLVAARRMADAAIGIYEELGLPKLVEGLVAQAHVDLAEGREPPAMGRILDLGAGSLAADSVAALQRAVAARAAGEGLVAGHRREDLHPEVARRLGLLGPA